MTELDDTFKLFDDHKLVGAIRASEHEDAVQISKAVMDGGFKILEISMSVPQAPRLIESIAQSAQKNSVLVGAGFVTDGEMAQRAVNAGAKFISCLFLDKLILTVCKNNNVFAIQSAATPTEMMDAYNSGVDLISLFPVDSLGGPSFCQRMKRALPVNRLMVSGGISCDNVLEYIKAGAEAIAVGSAICDRALIRSHNWQEITERAKKFQQKIESLKIPR